jgi:galactoside O-acetyltransferase
MNANPDANLIIGNRVLINAGGYLSGEGGLTIGDYALIGPNVCIMSAGHESRDKDRPIQTQGLTYGPIVLERDVWMGGGAVVLQGVTVGEGAVVGAGAVITKDVPAHAVVVGNPGRIVKYRGSAGRKNPSKLSALSRWLGLSK